jgi:hypothetical protein
MPTATKPKTAKKPVSYPRPSFRRSTEPTATIQVNIPESSSVKLDGYAWKEGSTPGFVLRKLWMDHMNKLDKDGYTFPEPSEWK